MEIIIWSWIILGGFVAYGMLGGEYKNTTHKDKDEEIDHYKETYDYFKDLSMDEQKEYIEWNADLKEYKDNLLYNNKESTAREVARLAYRKGKSYNNKNKRY